MVTYVGFAHSSYAKVKEPQAFEEFCRRRPYACPARTQGNQCGTCRACWDLSVPNADYELH